jgi:signal transduction histidine kinase
MFAQKSRRMDNVDSARDGSLRVTVLAHSSAAALRRNKTKILEIWASRMRGSMPPGMTPSTPVLFNALPRFMDQLAATLEGSTELASTESEQVAQDHGEQRATVADFSLESVIKEYGLLRKTAFEILEEKDKLPIADRNLILDVFENAVTQSTIEFIRIQCERLAAEQAKLESLKREAEGREKFVSTLAHDMRNPLTAARVSAELISQHKEDVGARDWLVSKIIGNINRVDKLIRDMLDANRISAGAPILLKWESCDLTAIVQELFRDLSVIYGNRFVLDAPASIRGKWGGEGLRRAIENLLSNAVKYGKGGTPITVSLRPLDDSVLVNVHNIGNPLSPEERQELFRPFGRTRSALESGKRGWGLGLMLAKAVAEAHRGTIEVESSAEKGTTFQLRIYPSCESLVVQAK